MKRYFSDYVFRSYRKRKAKHYFMCTLLVLASILAISPLLSIFAYVCIQGFPAINLSFFTSLPKPVGEVGGGMANALLGTCTLVGLAAAIGVPWGISIGVYLSEYGHGKFGGLVRFCVDMLASVPSIIIGLFAYALIVVNMKRFSALAGAFALSLLLIPTIARTTEEILKMVPTHIREAGLALGLARWKVTLLIVLKGCRPAIITGVMLSIARIAGETAPLLFTAFNNQFWQRGLDQPIASLPVQIYNYAISPYDDWHQQAWAGALLLVMVVVVLNLLVRFVFRKARSA